MVSELCNVQHRVYSAVVRSMKILLDPGMGQKTQIKYPRCLVLVTPMVKMNILLPADLQNLHKSSLET